MLGRTIARHGITLILTALLGGFLCATLVRLAPGFDSDQEQLDPHLSSESIHALRQSRAEQRNIFRFYVALVKGAIRGDLGTSTSLRQPVTALLIERAPLTARIVGGGLLISWIAVMTLALSAAWLRAFAYDTLATALTGLLICIPAAVLALLSVLWNVPGALAIGLIIFPRDYRYARNLLAKAYSLPHIVAARAKGLSELRILFWHERSGEQWTVLTHFSGTHGMADEGKAGIRQSSNRQSYRPVQTSSDFVALRHHEWPGRASAQQAPHD